MNADSCRRHIPGADENRLTRHLGLLLWNWDCLHQLWLSPECNVATSLSLSAVQARERTLSSILRDIRVQTLILRLCNRIAAKLIRLFGIHAQNSGKREQA
jgi:hypothetical protein